MRDYLVILEYGVQNFSDEDFEYIADVVFSDSTIQEYDAGIGSCEGRFEMSLFMPAENAAEAIEKSKKIVPSVYQMNCISWDAIDLD